MGHGPAWPIFFLYDGPRPGPARQIFRDGSRPGPAHQIFEDGPRPGPAHHMAARPMKHGLYMGRPNNYEGWPVDLTGRPMCCPVLKGACAYVDDVVFSPLLFFRCFSRLDSVGQLLSAQETHNQHPLLTQSCSTYDSVRWLPVDHLLVLLNTRCCCNSRCCSTLYRANITPVQVVIFWRRLPTLQQQRSSSPVRHRHS